MSYQVLARKWRPHTFNAVVGQEHVLTALANGLSLGRLHHAYLFSGTRGVGKTTIARLFAKGLNCETGVTATPCGVCDTCREIDEGRFVDLLEIDAASRTKIEDTRELLDNVQYTPVRGRFKVYLIDEVHMLSRHSFNALLKTLEEPPPYVKFLLATTDPQKLPVTILSRCLQFHLKALDVDQIRGQLEHVLKAEAIPFELRALSQLARAAEGSMRDALSLADQAIAMSSGQVTIEGVSQMLGSLDADQPLALIEALQQADGQQVMLQLQQAAERGTDWEALLVETSAILHRIAMAQMLPGTIDDTDPHAVRLHTLARTLAPQDVQLYYQTLLMGRKELLLAPDRRSGVEMTFLRALAFHPAQVATQRNKVEPFGAMAAASEPQMPVLTATPATRANTIPSHVPRRPAPATPRQGMTHRASASVNPSVNSQPTAFEHSAAGVNASAEYAHPAETDLPSGSVFDTAREPAGFIGSVDDTDADNSEHVGYTVGYADSADQSNEHRGNSPEFVPQSPPSAVAVTGESASASAAVSSPAMQALQAREQLRSQRQRAEGNARTDAGGLAKKAEPVVAATLRPAKSKPSPLERLALAGEQRAQQSDQRQAAHTQAPVLAKKKKEAYRWTAQNPELETNDVVTPDQLRSSLEHEKTPEMALKLAKEASERDPWSAQIETLGVAKLVEQLALNAVKEELNAGQIRLLLRSSQRHLNSERAKEQLTEALSQQTGLSIALEIVESDDKTQLTPLEIRQVIYEEKLAQARQSLQGDAHILQLQRLFAASVDESSIRPL
ncbi:MAG: DNA polymerase III subunit gamma/tau [Plesiomonas sp.]|uniref:DNA polymerase III subunit gamma/tau n=1 Tax=Plesiomonas sp. TaxID=2486279 RepID=UPI003F3000E6